jgi:hypothetical protein
VRCADGTAYGAQLAWSGNHIQSIDWIDDGRRQWLLGEGLAPGELRLTPGESITTPEVLATVSAHGMDGVAQAFHRAIRARIAWPGGAMSPRKVHLNTWEGFYFDHDLDALKELADAAADIGIERFVLDDGWFAGRDDDTSSLGDWWPDPLKYPQGLAPLARHVTGLGMEFGLWVEPEMVNPDSGLYRAHPDWALHVDGRPRLTARNQLVLDMSLPQLRDYLFNAIALLLRELPISYLKWDHNRDLTHAGNHAQYRAQVLGTYTLMERLRTAFPEWRSKAARRRRADRRRDRRAQPPFLDQRLHRRHQPGEHPARLPALYAARADGQPCRRLPRPFHRADAGHGLSQRRGPARPFRRGTGCAPPRPEGSRRAGRPSRVTRLCAGSSITALSGRVRRTTISCGRPMANHMTCCCMLPAPRPRAGAMRPICGCRCSIRSAPIAWRPNRAKRGDRRKLADPERPAPAADEGRGRADLSPDRPLTGHATMQKLPMQSTNANDCCNLMPSRLASLPQDYFREQIS